jgi:outer membrane protein assembly factor BamB
MIVEDTLYQLDLFDGSIVELGQIKIPLRANTPFVFDGKRYLAIAQESGDVSLYDLKKAKIKWQFRSGAPVTQAPVLNGKMLYILSEDHFIYALKLKNGHQQFRKKMPNKLRYGAAKSAEFLLLSPFNSRNLYMVEMHTGSSQNLFSLDSDRYHFVSSPNFRGDSLAAIYADHFSDSSFLIIFSVDIKR